MARFIALAIFVSALAVACIALPHHDKEHEGGVAPLAIFPTDNPGDSKFFFFPFNFWNGFKPLPWIPLPGLVIPTTAPPAEPEADDNNDGDDDDNDDDADDDEEDDDDADEDADEDEDDDEDAE